MKNLKYSVGIDVSKDDLKACITTIDDSQQVKVRASSTFSNTEKGIRLLVDWAQKHHREKDVALFFLMEATGVYHENLAWNLFQQSQTVIVVLPNKARKYLQSLGNKSKNDKIDAQGLSQMCAEKSFQPWQPISRNIYVLRSLTRLHEDLQVQKNSFSNRLKDLNLAMYETAVAKKSIEKLLSELSRQIKLMEAQILKTIREDPILWAKYECVTSIKGVGLMAFAVAVAETNGFALVKNLRQLTSYAGYDVAENQSGKKTGRTRISKKGNSHIRRILHLPAFSVVKYEQTFRNLYERVYGRGGIKMKAYVAVQRKLLCLMYTLWKNQIKYRPDMCGGCVLSETDG